MLTPKIFSPAAGYSTHHQYSVISHKMVLRFIIAFFEWQKRVPVPVKYQESYLRRPLIFLRMIYACSYTRENVGNHSHKYFLRITETRSCNRKISKTALTREVNIFVHGKDAFPQPLKHRQSSTRSFKSRRHSCVRGNIVKQYQPGYNASRSIYIVKNTPKTAKSPPQAKKFPCFSR